MSAMKNHNDEEKINPRNACEGDSSVLHCASNTAHKHHPIRRQSVHAFREGDIVFQSRGY